MVYKDNAYQPIFHFTEISKCHMCITSYCIGKSLLQSHSKQGEVSETRRTARQRLYSMILKKSFFFC